MEKGDLPICIRLGGRAVAGCQNRLHIMENCWVRGKGGMTVPFDFLPEQTRICPALCKKVLV